MIIEVKDTATRSDGYIISAAEEVRRVLSTRRGSVPMSDYGSDLYLYRDRTLDPETKLKIVAEAFDAIERHVKQVKPTRVAVYSDAVTGETKLEVALVSA